MVETFHWNQTYSYVNADQCSINLHVLKPLTLLLAVATARYQPRTYTLCGLDALYMDELDCIALKWGMYCSERHVLAPLWHIDTYTTGLLYDCLHQLCRVNGI